MKRDCEQRETRLNIFQFHKIDYATFTIIDCINSLHALQFPGKLSRGPPEIRLSNIVW
jgi:hypothetical protein